MNGNGCAGNSMYFNELPAPPILSYPISSHPMPAQRVCEYTIMLTLTVILTLTVDLLTTGPIHASEM